MALTENQQDSRYNGVSIENDRYAVFDSIENTVLQKSGKGFL